MNKVEKKNFSRLLNILLFFMSFSLSLFFCEIFVRKFHPQPLGGNFRTFSKNKDYFINIPNKKTFAKIKEYKTFYQTDSNGWRGGILNKNGNFKIAFLGDSYTFGLYLDIEKTYPYQFYSNLKEENTYLKDDLGIINAAIPASGIADSLAYLQDYGNYLDSRIIVLGINATSFSRGYKNTLFKINCSKNNISRELIPNDRSKGYDLISSILRENFLTNNSELYYLIRKSISKFREDILNRNVEIPYTYKDVDQKDVICTAENYLREIKNVTDKLGARLIVLNLGFHVLENNFFSKEMLEISPDSITLKNLKNITEKLDINYIDASSYIKKGIKEYESVIIPGDGHPNGLGNYQVSKALEKKLVPIIKEIQIGN